jgi:integrase
VIAPDAVERIRSRLDDTGAVMVSVLAYAGLRPGEVRALRWEHVGRKTLRVELGTNPDGTVKPTKTEDARNVELVAALAADLKAWRAQQGMPADAAHIFPRANGKAWTEDDYRNWRGRKFIPAVAAAGVTIKRPYDLRHSIASLWLQAGVNPVKVAEWLGHNVAETYKTYAHVLADLDPTDRTSAADRIAKARQDISGTHEGVKQGATKAKRKRRNGRARAKSAAGAGPT